MRSVSMLASRSKLYVAAFLAVACGCSFVPNPSAEGQSDTPAGEPDMKAIVAVVAHAYGQLGQAASVFLGADAVEDTTMARVRTTLGSDLATTFRPPSERATGDPGASIALGRFNPDEDGSLRVVASFVQADGTGRGCTEYTLEREGDDWVIAQTADAWPDCPISTQGEETYHAAVERARSDDCLRLGTGIGTCGAWLYVVESSGFHGTRSYFDPQTGLIVAQERFTDADEVSDLFVFGQVQCEPEVTDMIPCEPATTPWIECGGDLSIRGCDYSSSPVCGNDNRTYRNASEACCFVSRYQEGTCEASASSRADECGDGGGFWDCGGLRQCWFCNRQTTDAGAPCADGRECEGWCLVEVFEPTSQACSDIDLGFCSATTVVFGCFCEMYEGQGYGVCVD